MTQHGALKYVNKQVTGVLPAAAVEQGALNLLFVDNIRVNGMNLIMHSTDRKLTGIEAWPCGLGTVIYTMRYEMWVLASSKDNASFQIILAVDMCRMKL